jgi:hypothetical protein
VAVSPKAVPAGPAHPQRQDPDLTPVGPALATMQAAVADADTDRGLAESRFSSADDEGKRAATVADPPHRLLRGTVVGIIGEGAAAAARAAIVEVLTDRHCRTGQRPMVISHDMAVKRLDLPADLLQPAGLVLTDTADEALAQAERQLVSRARIDEDDERSGSTRRPGRLLLLTTPPEPGQQPRLTAIAAAGARLGICPVVLGQWQDGETLSVGPDGTSRRLQ